MLSSSRIVRIEWHHCDPAGIVYYPHYFTMFDSSTTYMFEKVLGMSKYDFTKYYNFLGYAMANSRATFYIPARFGDDVEVNTKVIEVKRSSISLEHQILKDGALAVEGWDTRVWVERDPADPEKIKSKPIPPDVVAKLTQ
jgi:4-hydroxybenzoyl-CoA thioesterase